MKRCGYRNGHKPRKLKRRVGTLELLFPRIREDRFQLQLFARYQRSEKALVSRVFRSLKRRGLRGVKLITSFDHEGLRQDVERHFQEATWQSLIHFQQSLLDYVRKNDREKISCEIKSILRVLQDTLP